MEVFPGPRGRDRSVILPSVDVAVVVEPNGPAGGGNSASEETEQWIRLLAGQRIGVICLRSEQTAGECATGGVVSASRDVTIDQLRGMVLALAQVRPMLQDVDRQLAAVQELGHQLHKHFDELQRELTLAARLQRDFLPRELPQNSGLSVSTLFRPCNWVSGDMFDVFRIDERRVGFYLVDAMGHGVSAALLTMFVRNAIRLARAEDAATSTWRPGEVLGRLNHALLAEHLPDCQFLTGWYGVFDSKTLDLTYANGGHPPAVWRHASGGSTALAGEGGLLGIFPTMTFNEQTVRLAPGDRLVIYSDGLEPLIVAPEDGPAPVNLKPQIEELLALPQQTMVTDLALKLDEMPGAFSSRLDDVSLMVLDVDQPRAAMG